MMMVMMMMTLVMMGRCGRLGHHQWVQAQVPSLDILMGFIFLFFVPMEPCHFAPPE